jgi:hypothetical protein
MQATVDGLVRYAGRFHALVGETHHVASPLGAWLLVALTAPGTTGSARQQLEQALGTDPDTAADLAERLLAHPHPLVHSAAALWHRAAVAGRGLDSWLAALPPQMATGAMPDQAALDAWARDNTLGLIDSFPGQVDPEVTLILATALATQVSWQLPFDLVPAARLGPGGAWASLLREAMYTVEGFGHDVYIAADEQIGAVAVHVAEAIPAEEPYAGLRVVSVIADHAVPAAEVLAAAHRVALGRGSVRRSLFDLPLGESPLWTIAELPGDGGPPEWCGAVLPAWSARSDHELSRPEYGMLAAADAIGQLLRLGKLPFEARQSAMARFHRTGFEAAAITSMAAGRGGLPPPAPVRREAELRFGHPYAVVAVASQWLPQPDGRRAPGPWDELPVFSAWVVEAEEPGE